MELAFTLALCLILLQLLRVSSSKKISIVEENVHAGLIRKNAAAASKERGGERESVRYISFIVMRAFVAYFSAHVYKFNTYTYTGVNICVCVCVSAPSVQLINFSWHPLLTTVGNRTQLKRVATSALWISLSLSLCVTNFCITFSTVICCCLSLGCSFLFSWHYFVLFLSGRNSFSSSFVTVRAEN